MIWILIELGWDVRGNGLEMLECGVGDSGVGVVDADNDNADADADNMQTG